MISNFFYQKTVDRLRDRMRAISRSYKRAFYYGFLGSLALFVLQCAYYVVRLIFMSIAWTYQFGGTEVPYSLKVFLPDLPLLFGALLSVVLSFLSFKQKMRIVKIIFFFFMLAFFIACVILLCSGFDHTSYLCAIIYTGGLIAVTIDCFLMDKEDLMLSKIEGYPLFDPLQMNDMEQEERPQLRFRDRSYEEVTGDREREYIENNPQSEMAVILKKQREEQREQEIGDWLDEMVKRK